MGSCELLGFLGRDPSEKNPENLGDKIRDFRRARGLSQKKFAERIRIDQSTLTGWEKHRPSKRMLAMLKMLFGSENQI